MTIRRRTLFGILVALVLGSLGSILAEEGERETSGSITTGAQGLSEDPPNAAKFSEFRDVPGGFVAGRFQFRWDPKPLFYFDLDALDIAQRDTRGSLRFGRQDLWKGTITWNDNPRRWGDDTETLFAYRGSGVFTLDNALQSAVQAAPASVDTSPADGQWDVGTKGYLIKNAITESAQDVDLSFQRRGYGLDLNFTPTRRLTVGAGWSRDSRSGTTPQPLGFYFSQSPAEVAAPVDFRTNWENVRAEYNRKSWNIGVQLAASQFNTHFDSLTWDNQLSLTDQAVSGTLTSIPGHGRLTLWTDNQMAQGTIYGGGNLPGHTRIDVTVSRSETTQDDPFLPMTINGNLAPLVSSLPDESFNGKHQNNVAQLRVSGRPLSWFRWNVWGRHNELKNESRSLHFDEYVQTDYAIPRCSNVNACGATTNRIQRQSLPYAFEKDSFGALAGFKPLDWLDLSVSFDRQDQKRDFSAVTDSHENTYKVTADFDVSERLSLRATAQRQRRRADEYDVEYLEASFPIGEPYIAGLNEGIRRFIWTDRDRDAASLYFEWTAARNLSLYGETTYALSYYLDPDTGRKIGDSYTIMEDRNFNSVLETYDILLAGRTFDKNNTYTLGISFSPNPRVDVYADYTWERFRYALASRYRCPGSGATGSCPTGAAFANIGSDDPLDNWGSAAEDTYETWTAGANFGLDEKSAWRLALTASRSEGTGDITTDFVPGGKSSGNTTLTEFPQLDTILTIATLDLTHRIRPSLEYTVRYWYEDWNEDNWAGDQMQQYMGDPGNDPGSVTSVFLGMDFDSYTYHVLSCMLNYRW